MAEVSVGPVGTNVNGVNQQTSEPVKAPATKKESLEAELAKIDANTQPPAPKTDGVGEKLDKPA